MSGGLLMSGFIGEYAHNIDKKGRIIIPSRFRDAYEGRLIVAKGLDGCLTLYTLEQWATLIAKVSALPNTKKDLKSFEAYMKELKRVSTSKSKYTTYAKKSINGVVGNGMVVHHPPY